MSSEEVGVNEWRATAPIVVLGGDGYLGWPLSIKLALRFPHRRILVVDNLLRRRLVATVSQSDSVLPLPQPLERVNAFCRAYGQSNMEFHALDVTSKELENLLVRERPSVVYHLAQMCSAPYSMSSADAAAFTIRNNEVGNMRLLWAVRDHVPDCHIVKLGSFGEYMQCGLDICEGYYLPEHNGQRASKPTPFPRQSDDIYHVSKINDSNYISVATRKWGLRVTDIMQATVFGTWTPETAEHPELQTRLDYDEMFGTVLNRFLVQALIGQELTVYGTGLQRTGLMALQDSVASLVELSGVEFVPLKGEHRVINHVTEKNYCIREIAELVRSICCREGIDVCVGIDKHDPREERPQEKASYDITTQYISSHIAKTPLEKVAYDTLRMILPYKSRIRPEVVVPKTMWRRCPGSAPPTAAPAAGAPAVSLEDQNGVSSSACVDSEHSWAEFREKNFPSRRVNLNSGTLGTASCVLAAAENGFYADDYGAFPLGQYVRGRECYARVRELAREIWPCPTTTEVSITTGASSSSNLLALALARTLWTSSANSNDSHHRKALRVLTSQHEHVGGVQAFERLPEFEVSYLTDEELFNESAFRNRLSALQPAVVFLSHVLCDIGATLAVEAMSSAVRQLVPNAVVILDVAQSLGLLPSLPLSYVDCAFGSCHKWLFGPRGTGLLWVGSRFRSLVGAVNFSGVEFHPVKEGVGFGHPGGQDFSSFAKLESALLLYKNFGQAWAVPRGQKLRQYFESRVLQILQSHGLNASPMGADGGAAAENLSCPNILSIDCLNFDPYPLYSRLNQVGVHIKCLKDKLVDGAVHHILRFSFPYFETLDRLDLALIEIDRACRDLVSSPSSSSSSSALSSVSSDFLQTSHNSLVKMGQRNATGMNIVAYI